MLRLAASTLLLLLTTSILALCRTISPPSDATSPSTT